MAKKDVLSNNYFKDKDRVADLLNVYLYNGEQILAEKDIQEINPVLTKAWWNNDELRINENITDVLYLIYIFWQFHQLMQASGSIPLFSSIIDHKT